MEKHLEEIANRIKKLVKDINTIGYNSNDDINEIYVITAGGDVHHFHVEITVDEATLIIQNVAEYANKAQNDESAMSSITDRVLDAIDSVVDSQAITKAQEITNKTLNRTAKKAVSMLNKVIKKTE